MQTTRLGTLAVFLTCMLAGMAPASARAQGDASAEPGEATEELRRYTVEMIIFEYAGSASDSNEVFIAEPVEAPAIDGADDELVFTDIPQMPQQAADVAKTSIDEIPLLRQLEIFLVEPDKYTMTEIYQKLQRLDAYRPIMHTAWTQTAVARELSPPVRLRRLGDAPLRLDGELTLYVGRFVHLLVNLKLDTEGAGYLQSYDADAALSSDPLADSNYAYSDKPDLRPARPNYRISENRIFRNGELRYFDHPKFGVLAKVTRYEPDEEEPDPAGPMLSGIEPR